MEDEFVSVTAYAKTISSTNKERHQKFLSARKATIKTHLKNPSRGMSDGDKKNVSDAATTLDTVAAETTRLHKPKMQFVTTEHWDEKLDGKFDPTKVREHNVFGKVEKGIWKRIGREGVYEGDVFEDKIVEERTRETDDSGPLGKLRMDHKKERLRSLLDNEDKRRNEAAVTGPPAITNVHDILNLLSSVGLGQAAASGDGEGEKSPSSSSSNSSSESSEEHSVDEAGGGTKSRLESFIGGHKRTPGGAGGSASGSAQVEHARVKPPNAGTPSCKSGGPTKPGSALCGTKICC